MGNFRAEFVFRQTSDSHDHLLPVYLVNTMEFDFDLNSPGDLIFLSANF